MGCGLIYAEMVSDKGLVYDSKKTKDMLYFEECERPIVQQIFGSDLDTFVEAAKMVEDIMHPDIIDMSGYPYVHKAVWAPTIIEKDSMYTENANRSSGDGIITLDNMEPNPKNPIIASFFRNIGWSDRLGSGVRNIFKYSKYYSGKEPEFIEGDVFRLIVPLNEDYSYDNVKNGDKKTAIKRFQKRQYKIIKKYLNLWKRVKNIRFRIFVIY